MTKPTNRESGEVSRLSVFSSTSEDCFVFMEPEGDVWTLPAGEHFYIHSPSVAAGRLEVGFSPEGIIIAIDPFDGWVVTDGLGSEVMRVDPLIPPSGYTAG